MRSPLALPAAFFLSGAAGLIFQVVWFYRCGLVLGSSLASITVVLSGFMAGLALGNLLAARAGDRLAQPLRVYAGLELLVGFAGVLITYLLPHIGESVVRVAGGGATGVVLNGARFGAAFVALLVPATAMGATLPILVTAVTTPGTTFGSALGRLYGWNTLGAVAGVVASEVVFIATVGVAGSAWIAAALNTAAAAIAFTIRPHPTAASNRTSPTSAPIDRSSRVSTGRTFALLISTSFAGATLLALEVFWFRFLSMYVLVTTLAMSLMLAVVLAGIALGGLAAAAWLNRRAGAVAYLPVVACASGLAVIVPYALFRTVTSGTQVGEWWKVLWFAVELTFPASMLSGLLFTLTGHALHRTWHDPARTAGWLALANTAGAIAGPPVAAYVLLPAVGMQRGLLVLALIYGVIALLAYGAVRDADTANARAWRIPRMGAAVALLVAVVAFPLGAMDAGYYLRAASAYAADGSVIVATREGASETLFVMQQQWLGRPVYSRLVTNGFSMSGTALQGQRYMRAFAYYPMLLHDGPLKKALVVCYGVGVTVGAVTHVPSIESIDVAEISRDIVAMSEAIYPAGQRPLDDPRVRLHIEDGRFFLESTSERFDLITGEPPPPRTPGTVNIYTREYFDLVRSRLNDGGIASYWVPVARPNPGTDVNTIIRAFCDVFSDCSLWNATPFDLMLLGSKGLTGPRTTPQLSSPWQTPGLEARLREVGFERPEQIGATFVGDANYLRELTTDTPPLIDDFPQRLRPARGRPSLSDAGYGTDAAVTRMYDSVLDVNRAQAAFATSPFIQGLWPRELIEKSLPYFADQAMLNRVYWEGGQPLRRIADLDAVVSSTTLRTLPLWMLGSDDARQRIAESNRGDATGAVEFVRALRALSGRDFAGAVQLLDIAQRRGLTGPTVRPLMAYALMKSGRDDLALQLAAAAQPAGDDERRFWEWLRARAATGTLNSEP